MTPKTIEEYILAYPPDLQKILFKIRKTILAHAPAATEEIAYQMPAYKLNKKPLVYFAAFKNHIGFYATPSAHSQFLPELALYKQGKGSVQFPLNKPIPYDLIGRMVEFKVTELNTKKS